MGPETQESEPQVSLGKIAVNDLRQYRLQQEVAWYLSEEGFLDFVRDCGAAPDAQFEPHGKLSPNIIHWNGEEDPEAPGKMNYKFKLVLWPRGSFKSAVFDVGYVCWLIAGNPNIRILVGSETGKQAKEFVGQAMSIIDSEWFKERFGVHRGRRWRAEGFTSALRTKTSIKEPTLQATGVGEVRTGMHWDIVLMDDVCSQENTKTQDSIEGLWNWFGETLAQLDPGCKLLVIGTLHHFADIYCKIQENPEIKKLFEISTYAWSDPIVDPLGKEPAKLFFPGRLTREYVGRQKTILPSRLYACFYENQPTSAEDRIFKPEYFKVIDNHDVPSSIWTYIFTDFAFIAEEKRKGIADRTVFWVVGIDCNRYAYVLDFYVGRWKPSDSVRIACDLWNRYQRFNVRGVVIEEGAHKEVISSLFDEIRRQTFIRPKIITITGRTQEVKDLRIEAVEPRFKQGTIYFTRTLKESYRKWKPMFSEMTQWPLSQHDDIPDAISDIDKIDKEGSYFCPAPPAGWRSNQAAIHHPKLINGRYNPDHGYPAREFTKANQQGGGQADLWRSSKTEADSETPISSGQNIWRRQLNAPGQLGRF